MRKSQLKEFLDLHPGAASWPVKDVEIYDAFLKMKEREHLEKQRLGVRRLVEAMARDNWLEEAKHGK